MRLRLRRVGRRPAATPTPNETTVCGAHVRVVSGLPAHWQNPRSKTGRGVANHARRVRPRRSAQVPWATFVLELGQGRPHPEETARLTNPLALHKCEVVRRELNRLHEHLALPCLGDRFVCVCGDARDWLRRGVLDREAFLAQLTSTQLAALGAPPDAVYSNAQDPVRQRRAKQASARM